MASGIEVAAAAAQVISLAFQVFQGCIDAYKFCHTAQAKGPEGDLLRVKLQVEHYRLENWASCAKLDTSSPDDRLNWPQIYEILQLQHTILTSGEKLKKVYGLDLPEIKEQWRGNTADEQPQAPSHGLDRILCSLRPKLYAISKHTAGPNGIVKRLQWAVGGRDKIIKVIDDLGQLNNGLERLLDAADRQWLKSGISALLRDTLSRSTDIIEVETLQQLLRPSVGVGTAALASAVTFKRIRLVLDVDRRPDEVRPQMNSTLYATMPHLRVFREKKLQGITKIPGRKLQTAVFEDRIVLVERRTTVASEYDSVEKHMQSLALLLSNLDNTFASLGCIGLATSNKTNTVSLVYDVPKVPGSTGQNEANFRNLYEMISTQRKCSLRDRMRIALVLAEAVLQLHTAGWLHKSIRSENILFVTGSQDDPATYLAGKPYLVGYDYSRPETEANLTGRPDAPLYTDLYRHPEKRDRVATSFKKSFDLFALGCLLTELALWERLVDIFSRHGDKDWSKAIEEAEVSQKELKLPDLRDILHTQAFVGEVMHTAGPTFLEAISVCLVGNNSEAVEFDVSLAAQLRIIQNLEQCQI